MTTATATNDFICLSFPRRVAEGAAETRLDLLARRSVVLRPAVRDLDRTHHRAEFTRTRPVPAVRNSIEKPRAIRVAAARRVDHLLRRDRRHLVALPAGEHERSLGAERADERLHVARDLVELSAALLLE